MEGTIRFYGTPAEENFGGKVYMVRAGFYDDVDACLSHHPSSVNVAGLASSNATNGVRIHYYGKTAHAAGNDASDDATLVEAYGGSVVVVDGEADNLKVTRPVDLLVARQVLEASGG